MLKASRDYKLSVIRVRAEALIGRAEIDISQWAHLIELARLAIGCASNEVITGVTALPRQFVHKFRLCHGEKKQMYPPLERCRLTKFQLNKVRELVFACILTVHLLATNKYGKTKKMGCSDSNL